MPEHQGTVYDGRYLRQLRFFVEPASYSPQTGDLGYYANLFFTNKPAGPGLGWAYDFDIRYVLDATLIQYVSTVGSTPRRLAQVIDPSIDDQAAQSVTLGGYLTG